MCRPRHVASQLTRWASTLLPTCIKFWQGRGVARIDRYCRRIHDLCAASPDSHCFASLWYPTETCRASVHDFCVRLKGCAKTLERGDVRVVLTKPIVATRPAGAAQDPG